MNDPRHVLDELDKANESYFRETFHLERHHITSVAISPISDETLRYPPNCTLQNRIDMNYHFKVKLSWTKPIL